MPGLMRRQAAEASVGGENEGGKAGQRHEQRLGCSHGPQGCAGDGAPQNRDDKQLPEDPVCRDEDAERGEHGRIRRQPEQLHTGPFSSGDRTGQWLKQKREEEQRNADVGDQRPRFVENEPPH